MKLFCHTYSTDIFKQYNFFRQKIDHKLIWWWKDNRTSENHDYQNKTIQIVVFIDNVSRNQFVSNTNSLYVKHEKPGIIHNNDVASLLRLHKCLPLVIWSGFKVINRPEDMIYGFGHFLFTAKRWNYYYTSFLAARGEGPHAHIRRQELRSAIPSAATLKTTRASYRSTNIPCRVLAPWGKKVGGRREDRGIDWWKIDIEIRPRRSSLAWRFSG